MLLNNEKSTKLIGGDWNTRRSKTGKIIKALLKKEFIIRIRHISLIFELLGACVISILLLPIFKLARSNIGSNEYPNSTGVIDLSYDLAEFFYSPTSPTKIVIAPNNEITRNLDSIIALMIDTLNNRTDSFTLNVSHTVTEDIPSMKDEIYKTNSNGIGIYLNGSSISLYKQSLYGDPDEAVVKLLLRYLTGYLAQFDTVREPYPSVDYANLYDIHISVAFLSIGPAILSTMGSGQIMLDEKEAKILTYMVLMGVSEVQYYFVQFLVFFILTLIPYIIYSFEVCYWFCMVGTSVTLVLFVSFLFVLSYTFFFMCIIVINQRSSNGRFMAVILAIFVMFFGYVHYFYTIHESASPKVKNLISIVPFSSYQLTMLMFYSRCKQGYPPLTWKDLHLDIQYPIINGILWLVADSVIYFVLFVLLNLFIPREVGVAPMKLRNIFKLSAWKSLFSRKTSEVIPEKYTDNEINAISVKNLTKKFGSNIAVDDVSFNIKKGEVIVMIGPNGAGKSTIINTISVALSNNGGKINLFNNGETTNFSEIHKYLGICFQENVLINLMSVKEHFEIFSDIRGISEEEKKSTMEYLGAKLQLEHVFNIRSKDLSGGQKRKLCLALSLLGNPPLIIMDEPTAGVDVQSRQLIWKTIASLKNSTCLITSHALEEAEAVSTRLFIVSRGKMPFMGTSTELRQQFHCGYLLRVEQANNDTSKILSICREFIPDSQYLEGRNDYILLPVHRSIPRILERIEKEKEDLGVISYAFSVEQLEDTLLRLIQHDEAAIEVKY